MKILLNRYTMEVYNGSEKLYSETMKYSNHICVFETRLNELIAEGYEVVSVNNRKKFAVLKKDA